MLSLKRLPDFNFFRWYNDIKLFITFINPLRNSDWLKGRRRVEKTFKFFCGFCFTQKKFPKKNVQNFKKNKTLLYQFSYEKLGKKLILSNDTLFFLLKISKMMKIVRKGRCDLIFYYFCSIKRYLQYTVDSNGFKQQQRIKILLEARTLQRVIIVPATILLVPVILKIFLIMENVWEKILIIV